MIPGSPPPPAPPATPGSLRRRRWFRVLRLPLCAVALATAVACVALIVDLLAPPPPRPERRESPGEIVAHQIATDERIPTRDDVSGVWSSGPDLVGFAIQLEQAGSAISGRGYHWGCLGIYDAIAVSGSIEDGKLAITFHSDERPDEHAEFLLAEVDGFVRFREIVPEPNYARELVTDHELRQREPAPR